MKKTLKIIPYFGKLPPMWDLYIESLKKNEFLDVLFITDIIIKTELPPNIRVVNMTLSDYFDRVEKKLNTKVEAKIPYKICELKPAIAYIFSEYLEGYEYWAYGDIDIIYGDLKRFLRKPFSMNADIISFREDWLSGPFTIIKNKKVLNELFLKSPDFFKILKLKKNQHFAECGKKYNLLREGYTPEEAYNMKMENDILCWTTLVHRLADNNEIILYTREYIKESLPWGEIIEYRNGKILCAGIIECALYHFISYKRYKYHFIPQYKKTPDYYFISPTGVYNINQFKWYKIISKWRYFKGAYLTFIKRVKDSYNYRILNKKH